MLLAVYGTLKRDQRNHHVLGNSRFISEYVIHGYDMYSVNGSYPAVVVGEGVVHIELYEVTDENTISSLDYLEGYSGEDDPYNLYNKVGINLEEGQKEVVYIYLYNQRVDNLEVVSNGIWGDSSKCNKVGNTIH